MKKNVLKKLGFKKIKVSKEESGDAPFYYYVFRINSDGDSLITPANDELKKKGKWEVIVFDTQLIIKKSKHLKQLFKILNLKKIKQ